MTRSSEVEITLRWEDAEECRLAGMEPGAMLQFSIDRSTRSFAVWFEDTPLAYWGWRDDGLASASCQAWMLSTPWIEQHRVFAARRSREFLAELLDSHYMVWVLVDPNYRVAVRWLEWLGFRITNHCPPFVQMTIERGGRA